MSDLRYHPIQNPGPIDVNRAFTISELIIYRFRDRYWDRGSTEYELLSKLADELLEVAQTWNRRDK